ncbi:MAG: HEAT repeat domain-containing protein [Planctomycetaceae bacterium]
MKSRVRSRRLVSLLVLLVGSAQADVIRLKNGGELRGSLQQVDEQQISIQTVAGSIVTVSQQTVHFVTRRSKLAEEYETRLKALPKSADSHWLLADWCRANRLKKQQRWQARNVLLHNPNHIKARRLLGYKRVGTSWTTSARENRKRGYVKMGRKYVPRQTRDAIARTAAEEEQQADWTRRISQLASAIDSGNQSALNDLNFIRDPMALAGLTSFFRESPAPVARMVYVRTLGQIKHPAALAPLVEQAILDSSDEVRTAAIESIPRTQTDSALRLLQQFLDDGDYYVVQRAAVALGAFDDPDSVEMLIEALITLHEYSTRPSAAEEVQQRAVDLLNKNDLTPAELHLVLQTSIIPPRAVEATIEESNGRIQVLYPHRNEAVLASLVALTGEDFGFDQRSWRLWFDSKHNR